MMRSMMTAGLAVLFGGATVLAGEVKLAENGKPLADIVIAADAGKSVRFGAKDLKWHLRKITGADFAIVTDDAAPSGRYEIRIGESKRTKAKKGDFRFQQYLVDVGTDATELVGWDENTKVNAKKPPAIDEDKDGSLKLQSLPGLYDKHGSLYAVYQFLEEVVGVKWVDCTEWGTLLPSDASFAVKTFSKRYEPFVEYRGGTIEFGIHTDCWARSAPEHKTYLELAYANPKAQNSYAWLYMLRHRAGGRYAQCNHSLYYFYNFYWNKNAKDFREFHPEYFSKGAPESATPTQLCYTRQDVVDRVAADISSYFNATNADKRTPIYSNRNAMGTLVKFWGDDNCAIEPMDNGEFCHCPECQKLLDVDKKTYGRGDSTLWFSFVKRVADKLLVTNPGCTVTTLAYGGHEYLPVGVTLPKNVNVVFCPSSNRGGPWGKGFAGQVARMRQWREAYPDQPMGVWFYNGFPYEFYNNARRQGVHGFYAHEAGKQYRLLKELNFRQGVFHCGLDGAIAQYLNFALMLDPEADVERLLGEYFSQYGAAARPLRAFYDLVEKRYCSAEVRSPKAAGAEQDWRYVCPKEIMDRLAAFIGEAEKCELSDVERKRVALFKLANWDYMKKGFDTFQMRATLPQPTWTCVKVPNAGGDLRKVAWDKVPELPLVTYDRGGDKPSPIDWTFGYRVANDDEWFYIELDQNRPSAQTYDIGKPGIVISPGIACYDTWELVIAGQRSMPYRYFLCGADGRMASWSNGEVNFRMNVDSKESGLEHFGAKLESDYSSGSKWRCRWAFPLKTMIDRPLKPGDTFYMNPATVVHGGACGMHPYGIFSPVTHSTVKTYDRAAEIKLAK